MISRGMSRLLKGKKRKAWEKSEKAEDLEKFEKKGNCETLGFYKKKIPRTQMGSLKAKGKFK